MEHTFSQTIIKHLLFAIGSYAGVNLVQGDSMQQEKHFKFNHA